MPKFILNDPKQTNSYGFKVLTEGINLGRFKENPVMLDSHQNKTLSVIGNWTGIEVKEGLLLALPEFDEADENAKKIKGKVDRGFLKGTSMGLDAKPENFQIIDGELVLTACELLEASIVAVPSNSKSLRLFIDGEELSETDIKTLCLSVAQDADPTPRKPFKPQNPMKKVVLSQLAVIALGFAKSATELEFSELDASILKLSAERDTFKTEKLALEAKLKAIEDAEKENQIKLSAEMIDQAIKEGQISAENKQTFVDLAIADFNLAKSTIEALPKKQTFSQTQSNLGLTAIATMDDFQKLDTKAQLEFKTNHPDEYKAILA